MKRTEFSTLLIKGSLFTCALLVAAGCYNPRHRTYQAYQAPVIEGTMTEADRALVNRVRDQLGRYGELANAARHVEVNARNGMVTLTGTTPSDQDKRMILAVVENTPGVTTINDQTQLAFPYARSVTASDRVLENRVRQALRDDPVAREFASNISVSAENGTVRLSGGLPSSADRLLAERIARNTPGVRAVDDDIRAPLAATGRVVPEPRYSDDSDEMFSLHVDDLSETDRTLAQRVLNGLRTDVSPPATLPVVNIHVDDGKVILRGTVLDNEQRNRIVSSVRRAAGANNVIDELRVQYR